MYPYYYREDGWTTVLTLLQQSLYAEGMVCSMSTQMLYTPEVQDLKGNKSMHNHLVPASYHRVTASGSAFRLMSGDNDQYVLVTLISCMKNAETQDKGVRQGLNVMLENADEKWKPFVEQILKWEDIAESSLAQAKEALQAMNMWNTSAQSGSNY